MSNELVTFLGDDPIGVVRRDRTGRVSFRYDDAWRDSPTARPLSLSMTLAAATHEHRAVEPFLWGLLPDNESILERWARRFAVSPRNAFALLANVGEDCAGAVRFATPDRATELQQEGDGAIEWLSDADVAERLRALRADASAWHVSDERGYFSLGGAQPKTALFYDGKRYGIPSGRKATTHIVKPDLAGMAGHSINEHVCLDIARELDIPAARSRVVRFGDELAIVVERYDRVVRGDEVVRIHQEDLCQALAIPPSAKYEADGGPGAERIVALLRESSSAPADDVMTFVRTLMFNWLIGGTDAHGKNYSVLLGVRGRARLAPLYDVASVLPYDRQQRKLKLAMKIGGKYRLEEIGVYQWSKLATGVGMTLPSLRDSLLEMAARLPAVVAESCGRAREAGLDELYLGRMRHALVERAERSRRILEQSVW